MFHFTPGRSIQNRCIIVIVDCEWSAWTISSCSLEPPMLTKGTRTKTRVKTVEANEWGTCDGEASINEDCAPGSKILNA